MKGKASFTKQEVNLISALIKQKLLADVSTQKKIRNKIRALGFYASDFGLRSEYTVNDFLRTINLSAGANAKVLKKPKPNTINTAAETKGKRSTSDEAYILDLCDKVLKTKGHRQHRFDFLRGDSGTKLPVDIFYPKLNLVIEHRERQHSEDVKFFNRRKTVSGVNRGEQRKIYDQRRRDLLHANGIQLIEIDYSEFEHDGRKRLRRNEESDLEVIRKKLKKYMK